MDPNANNQNNPVTPVDPNAGMPQQAPTGGMPTSDQPMPGTPTSTPTPVQEPPVAEVPQTPEPAPQIPVPGGMPTPSGDQGGQGMPGGTPPATV